ncbi:Rho-binding antiterminator [Pseudoalteromonas sp. KS88]|uniref:Rho-binding antiterminator n=1 Tax=Pseudoalteromonas sp. KS88 TaxID=2109918 RepID=UPI001081984D|nr:Rho-binding antiterminator [Pseudoalteromonas sp. KS88]TGE85084.1 Rho-binding antiterminator [Pseudoalteromonas sp. KS88]
MHYRPIKCGDYDQLELFCMQQAKVTIITTDDETLIGKAINLENHKGQGEFLLICCEEQGEHKVRLDKIKAISYF